MHLKNTDPLMNLSKERLVELILSQSQEIEILTKELRELRGRLSKKSHNSHKPPSSDGYAKPNPKSQRVKSGQKSGGQLGHPGSTLRRMAESDVDFMQVYPVSSCARCGEDLENSLSFPYERRQEFEIPNLKHQVIEHRVEIKKCNHCGCMNRGRFPDHITQPVQYGKRLKAIATYLNQYQLVPYDRLRELFSDIFSVPLSKGTLFNINKACYEELIPVSSSIKGVLSESAQAHFDETGLRVAGQLHWLHVASTARFTYYAIHPQRGSVAIESIGILPAFEGCATHDHFKPYFRYGKEHSLCNAHHLRELTYIGETYQQVWCEEMKYCLLKIKKAVDRKKSLGKSCLESKVLLTFDKRYDRILAKGFILLPKHPQKPVKPGINRKQHPAKNLFDRLSFEKKEVLRFMYDFAIPFDNNQAERDLRMMKVKQKISGCFRSTEGGAIFCCIKSYVSTVKKHALPVLEALVNPTVTASVLFPIVINPP